MTEFNERFPAPLQVQHDGPRKWRLILPYIYVSEKFGEIVVPAGFDTDLASVPKFARWFASVDGPWTPAAVIHDFLYVRASKRDYGHITRADADYIFREAMKVCGVPSYKRWAMWSAVRIGGGRMYRDGSS